MTELNQYDLSNKKKGPWQYYDNNENLVLACTYKDDRPVGVLTYYKEDKVVLEYEYPEQRDQFNWIYYGDNKKIRGYSIADKHGTNHFFENGQKLSLDQVQDILSVYETEVAFSGGYEGLRSYLIENLEYPERARRKGIQGEVYLSFVINKLGGIRDIQVVKGVEESLNQEAVRLIQQMPKWSPGTRRGYPIDTRHTMIIPFKQIEAVAGIGE